MAPETRSRGVPTPSRVYHSTPALQQVQFPSRKKKIRRQAASERKSLKQQTLTQIDFVSSFDGDDDDDDVIALSESDDDAGHESNAPSEDGDKENAPPPSKAETVRQSGQTREDEDEELLVSRGRKRAGTSTKEASKRRRTMGDDGDQIKKTGRGGEKSRRKTLGQVPPWTNYHTQTLTQFLGHQTSFVADSDDEDQDEGFLSWLGEPEPGSPSAGRGRPRLPSPAKGASAKGAVTGANVSRENSVIPQTPAKRSTTIRFEIPSGGIQSPSERMMGRYGVPGVQESPLKNRSSPMGPPRQVVNDSGVVTASPPVGGRKPSFITQDSYTTQGSSTPSKSQSQVRGTPPKPRTALDHGSPTGVKTPKRKKTPSPKKTTTAGLYEIPDSDEDEYIDDNDGEENAVETHETGYGVGIETQAVMGEIASPPPPPPPSSTQISRQDHRFPSSTQADVTPTCPRPRPMTSKPMRRPLHHPSTHAQPSQPWESQRVPVSVLQSLPAPSARSDIILPISSTSLESLITGHAIAIATSFKIPSQVVRFWLFENHLLRYMASVEPGEQQQRAPPQSSSQPAWRYHASQVYELNNPVQEQDMLEEGWIDNQITRYSYLPPAVIGQLLWNLRHPLFGDASEEPAPPPPPPPPPGLSSSSSLVQQVAPKDQVDLNAAQLPRRATSPPGSMTVSQQVTAQIHSDMAHSTQLPTSDDTIPSTPDDNQTLQPCPSASKRHHPLPPLSTPRESNQQNVHPSQATTLSQASTPERLPSQQHLATKAPVLPSALVPFPPLSPPPPPPPPPPPLFNASDNSIQFLDHTDSLSSLPFPSSVSSTSQLLTKSQTLPDSLIQDHAPLSQPEIWDSDDEDVSL